MPPSDKNWQAQYMKNMEERQEKNDKSWNDWSRKVIEEITLLSSRTEQLAKDLDNKYELLQKSLDTNIKEVGAKIDTINELLNGNGHPENGLVLKVALLQEREERRTWLLRSTIVACLGAIATAVFQWIKSHHA